MGLGNNRTSFATMRQRSISEAFTGDHHFEQFGYRLSLT